MPPSVDPVARSVDPNVFSRTVDFAGVFRDGALSTKPLSVQIRYSPINAHKPTGVILGTAAQGKDLSLFFMRRSNPLCTLESVSSQQGHEKVRSQRVLLREAADIHRPSDENQVIQEVLGRFDLDEFSIEYRFDPPDDQSVRQMLFFLCGPSGMWISHTGRVASDIGSMKVTPSFHHLRIPAIHDVKIQARHYFTRADWYAAKRLIDPHEIAASQAQPLPPMSVEAATFTLIIDDMTSTRSDDQFRERAIAVAETLCLIVSFLSKADIAWHAAFFRTGALLDQTFRDIEVRYHQHELWQQDTVLRLGDVRPFLAKAFTAYERRAAKGVVLRLPILLYVGSQMAPTVDERFILLFRALESTVDLLDHVRGSTPLITNKELDQIRRLVQSHLKSARKPKWIRELIGQKAGELRRLPLMHRLKHHLNILKVDTKDIGGEEGLRQMFDVRNRILHAAGEVPIERMVKERKRIQTLMERMMLRLLGWNGTHTTPTILNR